MNKFRLILIALGSCLFVSNPIKANPSFIQAFSQEVETSDSLYSEILQEHRKFWVKLPDNYDPNNAVKYPVVYLLDGFSLKNNLEAVYENYWGHYLPHMILVGVSNQSNRTRDLTTSKIEMRRGAAVANETGGAENFTSFIEKELIPFVDSEYPTTEYRTLIGHSYAGLFTINTLIHHNHLFRNYIAIDPSLDWDNQKLLKEAKAKLDEEQFDGNSLYVALAAEQLHMQNENITIKNVMVDSSEFSLFARSIIGFSNHAASLPQNGLNFAWRIYHEDLHGTVPLPAMRDGLVFLFKWYQFKSPQKYNNPETSVQDLTILLKAQEELYTKNFGYPTPPMIEEMLNAYGYMNLQMGQPERAFLFFRLNIEHYPKSANAFDSIADYYHSQNDISNALKYATKAFELSGSEHHKSRVKEFNELRK